MAVKQKFTGDANQLVREYEKILKQQVKVEQAIVKANAAQKKGFRQARGDANKLKTSLQGVGKSVLTYAAGFATVQTAASLVTAEMERQNRLAKQSKLATITVADSQAKVAKNIGDVDKKELQSFLDQVANISKESGFQSVAQLNLAASDTLSGVGGNQKRTLDILREAAPFFRDAPEDLAEFAGAMGDMMKSTGSNDAKEALGLMLSIQGQARFKDLNAFKNVAPALQGAVLTQDGVDRTRATREGAALFAGIGQTIGDVDGSITKTAVANLAANLRNVIGGENKSVLERLKIAQNTIAAGGEKGEQVKADLMRSGFKGSIKTAIEKIVSDSGSDASKAIFSAFKQIQGSAEFVDRKRQLLATGTTELEMATSERRMIGAMERFEVGERGFKGLTVENFQSVMDKTQIGMLGFADTFLKNRQLSYFDNSPEAAGVLVQNRIEQIRSGGNPLFSKQRTDAELSTEERASVQLLTAMLDELKTIAKRPDPEPSKLPPNNAGAQQTRVHDERE